jgi:hypothetical protein
VQLNLLSPEDDQNETQYSARRVLDVGSRVVTVAPASRALRYAVGNNSAASRPAARRTGGGDSEATTLWPPVISGNQTWRIRRELGFEWIKLSQFRLIAANTRLRIVCAPSRGTACSNVLIFPVKRYAEELA